MIKLMTFSHKRPDFLEMQYKSFKKNLEHDFEFVVFNNAAFDKNRTHYNQINEFCKNYNVQCVDVQKNAELISKIKKYDNENIFNADGIYSNPSIACAYPLKWAWDYIISKTNDKICIIDSDMFFVEKENIENILNEYDLAYMPQSRGNGVHYMWNGISYMNLANMPEKEYLDWWCGHVEGQPVDVGGHTFYYLERYKDLKKIEFKLHYVGEDPECDFSPANYEYFTTDDVKKIIHYRGGSNWHGTTDDYINKKTNWLKKKLQ